ncbi:Nucleolar protein 9 [Trapelia coarctata]|nr:Nucleolar protein 9 [Trapelia coarctata]
MPRELKKRGRREEKKRKREEYEHEHEQEAPVKQYRNDDGDNEIKLDIEEYGQPPEYDGAPNPKEIPFYGLLDEEEQGYFKRADTLLELNQFADAEERSLFLANVYREANGKELKVANSQSCSRLMERLMRMSSPDQLKTLFQKFSGHFSNLVQHRFASHCCETLFLQSAPIVTQELTAPLEEKPQPNDSGDVIPSMESLFLSTVKELEGNLGYLITDNFASHTLRVLLVVLSGRPLSGAAITSLLQSKKKETVDITAAATASTGEVPGSRTVPESFTIALDDVISRTIAGLNTTYLQALATHPTGNPVLQLLLELEFAGSGKSKARDDVSIFRRLIPDDPLVGGTNSASFIKGLLYDPVGSRLLETVVQYAPGKQLKALYKAMFRESLSTLVKNDIASYVVIRILERLSHNDLQHAVTQICPQLPLLIERSRTSIIKVLIERCQVRQVGTEPIADAMKAGCDVSDPRAFFSMLKIGSGETEGMSEERKSRIEAQDSGRLHGSLMVQAMVNVPGPLRDLVMSNILAMSGSSFLAMARDRAATHVLQAVLTCEGQTKPVRRKIVQQFIGHIEELALDPIASHVVDTFWQATEDTFFVRETIAEELQRSETALRDSFSGRAVWRNWRMDLFKRRRVDWIAEAKGVPQKGEASNWKVRGTEDRTAKSAIELARERFAAAKAGKGVTGRPGMGTGVNVTRHSRVSAKT